MIKIQLAHISKSYLKFKHSPKLSLNFYLLLDKNITYLEIPILGKKVSLIAFRQVLTEILPAAFIQLHNYELFEKVQLKLSLLIQNSFQQDYIPESYARYLNSYQECQKIVAPIRHGLSPLPLNRYRKPWGWGKILPNSQKSNRFPHQKNSL